MFRVFTHLRRFLDVAVVLLVASAMSVAFAAADETSSAIIVPRGDRLLDLERNLEWQRCAVGQKWTTTVCAGTALAVPLDDLPSLIRLADPSGREGWRLPTRDEIATLRCSDCPRPAVHRLMAGIPAAGYWTSEENGLVPGRWWSVDLTTFRAYGRTERSRRLYVLFVRDR